MASERPWLAAVSAGRWQLSGIKAAQCAGIRVLALDGDLNADGFSIADDYAVADVRSPEAVLDAVRKKDIPLSGAVSFASEAGILSCATLRDEFGLPGPGLEVSRRMVNKGMQRAAWEEAGLPNPEWCLCRSVDEASIAIDGLGLPVIVKPSDSAGSRGVSLVESASGIAAAVKKAFIASSSDEILVESVLAGREFTVEIFSHLGETTVLLVTVKRKAPGSGGVVADQLATSDLPEDVLDKISAVAIRAFEALEFRDGAGHLELFYDPIEGIGLVEAAGRGGGFMVFENLVPRASGFDIVTAIARQAVGLSIPQMNLKKKAVVLRFWPSSPGRVTGLTGFDRANVPDGVEVSPLVTLGQVVGSAASDGDRLGYIVACADTPKAVLALADEIQRHVAITIDPVEDAS